MSKKVYFCTNCRKRVDKVQNLLFVEESKRGFCSESCIVEFFSPYMEAFDHEELEFRHMLGLESSEVGAEIFQDRELFDQVLYYPGEVWYEKNEIQEEFYTHILSFGEGNKYFYIITCTYFEGEPSFVFFKTVTQSSALVDMYRKQKRIDDNFASADVGKSTEDDEEAGEELTEINLPAEMVEDLELKKSEYLAVYLERRQDHDLPIEDFPRYEQFLGLTLEDADEEYLTEDDAGDEVMTFIKSFQMNGIFFFYIACCVRITLSQVGDKVMIPILSFPSIDQQLYKYYAVGQRKNEKLTN